MEKQENKQNVIFISVVDFRRRLWRFIDAKTSILTDIQKRLFHVIIWMSSRRHFFCAFNTEVIASNSEIWSSKILKLYFISRLIFSKKKILWDWMIEYLLGLKKIYLFSIDQVIVKLRKMFFIDLTIRYKTLILNKNTHTLNSQISRYIKKNEYNKNKKNL